MSIASGIRSVAYDQTAYEDPDTFRNGKEQYNLTKDEQETLLRWIQNNFTLAPTVWRKETSYTLKHVFERCSVGFYVTNGHFKGAMLAAGFSPANPSEKNWHFRIRYVKSHPAPGTFLAWLRREDHEDGYIAGLALDTLEDRSFPSDWITEADLRTYYAERSIWRAVPKNLHEIWEAYERFRERRARRTIRRPAVRVLH